MSTEPDLCRIERHGDVLVLVFSSVVESLAWDLIEDAAIVIMDPIRKEECPSLVVDLNEAGYFGSVFLSLLLSCWKRVATAGGSMVLCTGDSRAKELLRVTGLDNIWACYDRREDAIAALESG